MSWRWFCLRVVGVWAVLAPWVGMAQVQGVRDAGLATVDGNGNAQTVEDSLHLMSKQAAVIFVGSVAAVRRIDGAGVGSGVVEIDFAVEQAVRGCTAGATYTVREWAGLWEANEQRYRVGQELLMLLRAPGATGLSSPVGGMDGAIPVRGGSGSVGSDDAEGAMPERVADMRWVGAKLARTVRYKAEGSTAARGIAARSVAGSAAGADTVVLAAQESTASAASDAGSIPAQEASVSTVLSKMAAWTKVNDAAR